MNIKYRPEIDGLRAIAVGAVIIYHAQINIFGYQVLKGGFLGVDIFFVISGYLISSIIFNELGQTNQFSFKYFYERRIRRIFPSLLTVMLVSIIFSWIFLLPDDFRKISESILSSIGFVSNFYFYFSGLEYDSEIGLFTPFLHTWSLSIEEQFYLIFPALVFLCFIKYRDKIFFFLVVITAVSFLLANYSSFYFPSLSFYSLPTRIWELILGSLISYKEFKNNNDKRVTLLSNISTIIGLVLIILPFLYLDDKIAHPSIITFIPVLGVCLIIHHSSGQEVVSRLLSLKFLVFIGLISYSLYLWHYPVFAFSRITEFTSGSISKQAAMAILIFIISILTYFFIEKPARNKRNHFKTVCIFLLGAMILIIITCLLVIRNDGYKNRLPENFRIISTEPWKILKNDNDEFCYNKIENCKFNEKSDRKIYLIGDSHMGALMYDLKEKVIQRDYQFITSTFTGCLFFPGFDQYIISSGKIDKNCNNEYFSRMLNTLENQSNSIFIFGGRFPLYLEKTLFNNREGGVENNGNDWGSNFRSNGSYNNLQSSFKETILKLSKQNQIILIYPIPEVGWDVPKKVFYNRYNNENISTSYEVYKERNKSSFEMLNSIEADNIHRIYPHELFCDLQIKDRCVAFYQNQIFYSDDEHPSSLGVEMINELILNKIINIK